ncbi:MAG: cAMP-binding domain of CRP or a regulatory subunit of cAMP-dependent protein kinases [Sporanaerobacter sp.]|uniref:Crp/Fnr family transcriptional regulator n=1 Tax=Sporanaerobacter sp. TaxID=2010183 RepID=UPI003A10267A
MEIVDIIESNGQIKEMLKDCPYDILKRWKIREYPKDYVICHQDMKYEYFCIIVEGYANIYLTAENGKKFSQSIYKKGDYFGELEIFDNKPYICSIEALTELRVIGIHRKYFLQWIDRDRHFSLYITRTLCDSFYKLSKMAGENTLYSLKYRICNYLLYRLDSGTEIKVNKEQLSEQFAVTQRSINRVLQQLKEKNLIEVSNNSIFVIDIEGLVEEEKVSRNE